jgi:hypothetical protein
MKIGIFDCVGLGVKTPDSSRNLRAVPKSWSAHLNFGGEFNLHFTQKPHTYLRTL